jgi:hypothetical protein
MTTTELIMEAQAELQTGLGMHRCEMEPALSGFDADGTVREAYLAKALAFLHVALQQKGIQMMHPAIHPDVPHNHDPKALKP